MLLVLIELPDQFAQVGALRKLLQDPVTILAPLSVEAQQALLHILLGLPLVLLAVVGIAATQVERITYQHRLDFLVERAGAAQTRRDVNLEEPRLELVVE